jgi:transcriptional regulator of arginine metabolism
MPNRHLPIDRQKAIVELVKKFAISDQKQLVDLLVQHYGIETNQAVISRDLRKLSVVKKMRGGELVYDLPESDIKSEILRLALVGISHNESMIVIKTQSGMADFVGDWVDQHQDLEVLGCLAGENVVFVAPKSIKNIKHTFQIICEKFKFRKT